MAGNETEDEIFTEPEEVIEGDTDNDESFDLDGGSDEDVDKLFEEAAEEGDEDEGEDPIDEDEEGTEEPEEGGDDSATENDAPKETEQKADETSSATTEADALLAAETAKRVALETQVKKTLETLGIKTEGSALEALERAAAEAEDISIEEYRKKVREENEIAAAKEQIRRQKFEALCANDLAELKKSYSGVLDKKHIRDCFKTFDDFAKFGRLRDAGIDAKDAYLAVNGDEVIAAQKNAAKMRASDNKEHLKSSIPKNSASGAVGLSKQTMAYWRELFPELSDSEIRALYKKTEIK